MPLFSVSRFFVRKSVLYSHIEVGWCGKEVVEMNDVLRFLEKEENETVTANMNDGGENPEGRILRHLATAKVR